MKSSLLTFLPVGLAVVTGCQSCCPLSRVLLLLELLVELVVELLSLAVVCLAG